MQWEASQSRLHNVYLYVYTYTHTSFCIYVYIHVYGMYIYIYIYIYTVYLTLLVHAPCSLHGRRWSIASLFIAHCKSDLANPAKVQGLGFRVEGVGFRV